MENKTMNQKAGDKDQEIKKPSDQPTYGDKPWQTPQEESCGCGPDSEKGNKKNATR
jgi:hypothetical protein